MKRVVTIRVENRYDNDAPLEYSGYASREYHVPLTTESPTPSEIVDGLDEVIIEKGWLK